MEPQASSNILGLCSYGVQVSSAKTPVAGRCITSSNQPFYALAVWARRARGAGGRCCPEVAACVNCLRLTFTIATSFHKSKAATAAEGAAAALLRYTWTVMRARGGTCSSRLQRDPRPLPAGAVREPLPTFPSQQGPVHAAGCCHVSQYSMQVYRLCLICVMETAKVMHLDCVGNTYM